VDVVATRRQKGHTLKTTLSYKALINVAPNGIIDSMVNNMRELQDLYDIMMFSGIIL
jgi:hypothetical protein